jgi:hypothetical protein
MRSIFILSFVALISIFLSCSKKQDTTVTPISAISFTGIRDADTLKGTISAQIIISGTTQPKKIEVYANDSLIATGNKAPYNLQWNTLGVTNGNYKLKAIACDDAGKQSQTAINVIVQNILVTLKIDPKINSLYNNIMYIVTDPAGNVLNSIKYNGRDKNISIAAVHPYRKNRFSVFEVKTYLNTYVTAYLNIPRGSTWDLRGITENFNPKFTNANINFTNVPSFSRMTISSDVSGLTFFTASSISNVINYGFSPAGKELVQFVDNNNNGHYNFFNVDRTKKNFSIALTDSLFHPSVKKTITINGATSGNFSLYGKSDKNYDSYYLVDGNYFQGPNFSYFYPYGTYLTDYKSYVYFIQNGLTYINVYTNLIPETIAPIGATANVTSSSLHSFNFSSQGNFDYYTANFSNVSAKTYITVFSKSHHHSFRFPDILKLTNIPNVSLDGFKIFSFSMFKTSGFNEGKLFYYNNNFPALTITSQSSTKYY